MAIERTIKVRVAYALPARQYVEEVSVPVGSTVRDAIEASTLLHRFSDIDLARNRVGVYSRLIELDAIAGDGDRIEIYRSLIADPKDVRRQRAKAGVKRSGVKKSRR